jgi:eukaryotic-like serine/threonine-protein kinase
MPDTLERLKAALADRYTLQRELGRGGMATVYLAEDRKHHRPVALKVLRPELAAALGPDRFLREIELSARLTHPHILPLHDSGNADGFLYYVMPYVEGESLRDRLTREKQLPVDDALQISREIADALSYAHSHGVIHRDIKPENILLESGHAVVADFGIAKAIALAGEERLTETGLAIGTPAYMSPEQAAGSQELDGRSDLYSLGCVLYEMLSGEAPYTGATPQAILAKKLGEPLPRVSVVREAVPTQLEEVLRRALARTPADRFLTATAFSEALSRGPSDSITHSRLPRWRKVLIPAAVFTLLLGAGAVTGGLLNRADTENDRERLRLVVLPFTNRGAIEDAPFAGGMTDVITAELARISGVEVLAPATAHQYEAPLQDLTEIAKELDVTYALTGSIQRERPGDPFSRVRIVTQLVRTRDNATVWAGTLERDSTNVFEVQTQIAMQVAERLDLAIRQTSREDIRRAYTRSSEAWDAFLRGLDRARSADSLSLDSARRHFDRAIARDSSFALAYAWRSWTWSQLDWMVTPALIKPHREAALRDAERALRLDPALGEAHWALGTYHYTYGPTTSVPRTTCRKPAISDPATQMSCGSWPLCTSALERGRRRSPRWTTPPA